MLHAVQHPGKSATSFPPTETTSESAGVMVSRMKRSAGRRLPQHHPIRLDNSEASTAVLITTALRVPCSASKAFAWYATSGLHSGGVNTRSQPLVAATCSFSQNLLSSDESPAKNTISSAVCAREVCAVEVPGLGARHTAHKTPVRAQHVAA
eukprot:CAMPEP_0182942880 /NCGR_PEP_ID=MMETSP0105_2-20130417/51471_1 /TAXON_ID=81532 ORGANISM="Acanthoeca-like sp., Strain 10tr" /NCGR_SAMPLE_ID=MMETSP0105_2 /ASSEMBLY_ACC=CAM_ASM_000205 /LENGTH=151 /DNA_ID=CAMNT_0025082671 /DNA_START=71 /DNA_END=523 /DNA_ORIENTATION=+